MKKENNTLEFENNEKKSDFKSNKLIYYYKEVFNIEIMFFLKKKNKQYQDLEVQLVQNIKNKHPLNNKNEQFYILIKDNNRKIFKYKLIKSKLEWDDFINENIAKEVDLNELFNFSVDKALCNYCEKHKYINTDEILIKDREINEKYQQYIQEQNQKFQQN